MLFHCGWLLILGLSISGVASAESGYAFAIAISYSLYFKLEYLKYALKIADYPVQLHVINFRTICEDTQILFYKEDFSFIDYCIFSKIMNYLCLIHM
jgi:hypothetical protein